MSEVGNRTLNKPKRIYDILERLGLRTVGTKAGRPKFPPESKIAKSFYWQTQRIFGTFCDRAISRDAALARTLELLDENGPLIWGADRSSLVEAQSFPDFPKDLQWDKPVDQEFIRAQTIDMFEYREKNVLSQAKNGLKRQVYGPKQASPRKRVKHAASPDSVLPNNGARNDTSEYSPSMSNTPEPERPSETQAIDDASRTLIVKLRYRGCLRCSRQKIICDRNPQNCVPYEDFARTATSQPKTQSEEHLEGTPRRHVSPNSAFLAMITTAARNNGSFQHFDEASVAQVYETMFLIRVRGKGQQVSRVKLGFCSSVVDLFEKFGDSAGISAQSIIRVSICLPADVGELQGLDIQAGEQEAFELLLGIISRGVVDVGATVPGHYMLPTVVVPVPIA
ncbi:hypothetical protein FKW77_010794 [Venturia effusa]|uniref:Zn(2)-C6 fungal-type domain-containing protein n=1 Tax=Venturia effusa TaxID=50376 RepID=A0A517KYG4_9PEZI|nr:hypothetical protein FKW77_010794 [Venturia effusa]